MGRDMSPPNGNGIWLKILGPLIPLVIMGLIGYGVLTARVDGTRDELRTKANREVVDAQYQSILRELQSLRQLIEQRRP